MGNEIRPIAYQSDIEGYCEEMGESAEPPEEFTKEWLASECAARAMDVFRIWENLEWVNRVTAGRASYDKAQVLQRTGYFDLIKQWKAFFEKNDIEEYGVEVPVISDRWDHSIDLEGAFLNFEEVLSVYWDDFKWFAAVLWNLKTSDAFGKLKRNEKRMVNVSLLLVGKEIKLLQGDFGDRWK